MPEAPAGSAPVDSDVIAVAARAHEYDRYLTALLAPRTVRRDLIVVAAFVGEISRIPVFVSEAMIGEIRLQWWRDAIAAGLDGARSGNPVADAIVETIKRHGIPVAFAQGVIDAQSLLFYDAPPRDEMELRQHLAKVHGGAFAMAARIVDRDAATANSEWVRDAGVAYGIARTALEMPAWLAQGRIMFPATWISDSGHTPGDLKGAGGADVRAQLNGQLCETAETLFADLRTRSVRPAHSVRSVCRALAMVPPYCAAVKQAGFGGDGQAGDVTPLRRVWTIWRGRV